MEDTRSLSASMQQTIEYGNFEFVGTIGELAIDAIVDDGLIKDIPLIGTIVGVGKCIKNAYDYFFAKKLIAFIFPIKDVPQEERLKAIKRWESDENYRGNVGETLIGMIARCDDSVKAIWLSKLFYELVLKRDCSRLFMRAEKILSSLSVMDLQAFLSLPKDKFNSIREGEVEPFIGSGLYLNPKSPTVVDGRVFYVDDLCEVSEVGIWIYSVLNDIPRE